MDLYRHYYCDTWPSWCHLIFLVEPWRSSFMQESLTLFICTYIFRMLKYPYDRYDKNIKFHRSTRSRLYWLPFNSIREWWNCEYYKRKIQTHKYWWYRRKNESYKCARFHYDVWNIWRRIWSSLKWWFPLMVLV